jgi:hypothetical protein
MLQLHRLTLIISGLALIACVFLYASLGIAKPFAIWKWTDIISEGGTAVMAGIWVLFTLSSRPGGLVTRLLAGGLAMIMIGSFADCLDEFFAISKPRAGITGWKRWCRSACCASPAACITGATNSSASTNTCKSANACSATTALSTASRNWPTPTTCAARSATNKRCVPAAIARWCCSISTAST